MTGTDSKDDGATLADLHPSGRSYARAVLPVVPLGLTGALLRLRAHGQSLTVGLSIIGAVTLAAVAVVLWYAHTERVWCDRDAVHRRDMFGLTRTVRRGDVATVFLATRYKGMNRPEGALFALLDSRSRSLMRLLGPIWAADDVATFVTRSGLGPVVRIDEPTTAKDLRASHPAALPYSDRRPGRFFLLAFGGAIAGTLLVIAVVAVIVVATGNA